MIKNINEKEIQAIDKEIAPFIKVSESISISNPKDLEKATVTLSEINRYKDKVKKKREEITKPINEGLKLIRSLFSPLEDKLELAVKAIKSEMISYQTEQKKIADAEKEKIENRIGEGKGKLKFETAVKKIDEIQTPEKNVDTGSGSIKFKTVKKFEVVDISKLPIECLTANEVQIRKLMNAGIEVTGVRYFTEEVPSNFR